MNTLLHQQDSEILQALAPVYAALLRYGGLPGEASDGFAERTDYAPLKRLVESFGLSSFERDVLLLCAGVEIDPRFAEAMMSLPSNMAPQGRPSFGLALACLENPHLSAISPSSALRGWQFVEVVSGDSLLASRSSDRFANSSLPAGNPGGRRVAHAHSPIYAQARPAHAADRGDGAGNSLLARQPSTE